MKTKILILAVLSLALVNCSKSSDSQPTATPPVVDPGTSPWTPPVDGTGQGPGANFTYGGTTNFVFDSKGVYNQYTGRNIQDLSELANVRVNLNFDKYNSTYGGTVTVRYNYQGQTYEGFFTSGNDASTNRYNIWFDYAGAKVFHGFFEDFRGGVIVVIDNATSLANGVDTQDTVSGSIWFKNFPYSTTPHPATYCWFIHTNSTYDCRAWKSGDAVNTTAGVYPNTGYTRLGTFTGMPATKAFNGLIF